MSNGSVQSDPLFVGLTRPSLFFGVSLNFAIVNILISGVIFINFNSLKVIFIALILHLIGYVICFKEPRIIELYIIKLANFSKCPNKMYYGGNSYKV